MKVFNLQCSAGHRFEGWFQSSESCEEQRARRLLSCPVCDSVEIERRPSAPHVQASGLTQAKPASLTAFQARRQMVQERLLELAQALVQSADDVGRDFPEEARRIHYQEAPERMIVGQATAQETQALQDEGIDVLALPIPVSKPGILQ